MYPEVSFAKVTISKRAMDQSYQSVQVGCPKSRASSQNQKPNGLGLFTLWSTSIIGKVEELWTLLALPGTILICWIFMIIFSMDWLKLQETIDFPIKKKEVSCQIFPQTNPLIFHFYTLKRIIINYKYTCYSWLTPKEITFSGPTFLA